MVCYVSPTVNEIIEINDIMRELGASEVIRKRVKEKCNKGDANEGFTYSALGSRFSLMLISKTTSAAETMNTIVHEVRHLTDDIAKAENIPLTGEEVAYLSGDVSAAIFKHTKKLFCDCCRKQ